MQKDRINKIIAYKERCDRQNAEAAKIAQEKYATASNAVKELYPRIKDLIEVANSCEDNGISIMDFISNAGYPIGFLPSSLNSWISGNLYGDNHVNALGKYEKEELIRGENGEDDKIVHRYFFVTASNHGLIKDKGDEIYAKHIAPTENLNEFAEAFEKFEQGFYSYVDRIVSK